MSEEGPPVLYMAPVMGITDSAYRCVYDQFFSGYDVTIAPFIVSCAGGKIKSTHLRKILPERNIFKFKLIPQILGKNADDFIVLAKAMFDLGYDTVNWNLGCPILKVQKKMRGSGLLPHPDIIAQLLDKIIPKIPNKLSIKVRLGAEDPGDLVRLLPALNPFPLEEIIIHARTGKQLYTGDVDISAFENCLGLSQHDLVYNGDINSLKNFNMLKERFPMINRWMIGRGGIINPFLPEQIKEGSVFSSQQKRLKFIAFHGALFSAYQQELNGPAHILSKMKEVWFYWQQAFKNGKKIYKKICITKCSDKYLSIVDMFLKNNPIWLI
ncbi:hypothetical protein MNBD_UNCLBAC01-212 [hydrothermal vent metagenome]|uniref:DUS-like FMN-binding domain-containing protein n=1 Tax=hydrothermal vent metagenome TaxID=652676 RepID=A0A3B1DV06_9ZZZZ